MVETTWDASGWVWIRKHTRVVHRVFDDLRSCGRGRHVKSALRNWVDYSRKEVTSRQRPTRGVPTELKPMGEIDTPPFKFVSHRMVVNIV